MQRRHRFYRHIFAASLLVMVCMPLPFPFKRMALSGTVLLMLLLSVELGQPVRPRQRRRHWSDLVYRWTGVTGLLLQILWMISPASFAVVGFPMLVLITGFIFWSLKRLLICLAQEMRVGMEVLAGAVAGYLLLGISGGLLFSVMETVAPGSFLDKASGEHVLMLSHLPSGALGLQVWSLDFTRIQYFAFASLTTVGYGDIIPGTSISQMASVALSICGPLYLAIVMGLLISRYTLQNEVQVKPLASDAPVPPPHSGVGSDAP